MDIFHQIAIKIIKEQESIIGKLAWKEIKNIPGVVLVDAQTEAINLTGDKQEAINNLVAHFNRLFGRASFEISQAAVEDLLQKLPPNEIPSSLRDEKVAIEKITEDLYRRNVELAAKNEILIQLRERLEQSNQSLESANQKLKRLDQAKDDFINIASHQLKSPIAILKSVLEVNEVDRSVTSYSESLKQIARLETLVSEVLLASKLTQEKYTAKNLEEVDLERLLQEIVGDQRVISKEHTEIKLVLTEKHIPKFLGEPLYLREALTNVVHNATKYSRPDTKNEITITLGYDQLEKTFVIICEDKGIGISKEDLPKLFTKFSRGTNVYAKSGTGLGLYITKEIIEGHNGTITLESEAGRGTRVKICLPLINAGQDN
jgi:signal transduction histidine kinase